MQRHTDPPPRSRSDEAIVTPKLPFPWVTAFVIGASFVVFGSELFVPKLAVAYGALFGPLVQQKQWWRLITYVFVHANALHIGMNMLVAYQMGVPLERRIGSARFAEISLVTALGGAAGVMLFAPTAVTVGASGMILGWAGLIVPLLSRENLRRFGRFLVLNAVISFLPGVSWQGHLGGFVAGLACGLVLRFQSKRFAQLAPALIGATALLAIWAAYRGR